MLQYQLIGCFPFPENVKINIIINFQNFNFYIKTRKKYFLPPKTNILQNKYSLYIYKLQKMIRY